MPKFLDTLSDFVGIFGFSKENNKYNELRVSSGGRLPIIEYAHLAVHEDTFVTATERVADLDILVPRNYHIKPLDDFNLHSVFLIKTSAECHVQIYEDSVISVNGTRLLHMRNNRIGAIADTDRDTTYHTPTIVSDGTLIYDGSTGGQGGSTDIRVGGESRSGQEIVLKENTHYLIRITTIANNTIMSFNHEYYEVSK